MKFLLAIFSLFVMIIAWATEPRVTIAKAPLVADQGIIYLRDIATFENIPKDWMDPLGEVEISKDKNQFYSMTSRDFMKKIRHAVGEFEKKCHCHVQLSIPRTLLLYSFNGEFEIEKAKRKILHILDSSCNNCEFQLKEWKHVRGQVPKYYKGWTVDSGVENLRGSSYINVYFDNNVLSPVVFSTKVQMYGHVLKAKKSVIMGRDLEESLFHIEKINLTHERRRPAQISDLKGAELRRSLSAKQIVYIDDLVERNLAMIGQPVSVEFSSMPITLEMPGIAKKSGKLGDMIPVMINKTKKRLMAEVTGKGRVRIKR